MTSETPRPFSLREYGEEDFETLTVRWHETNRVSYPYNDEQQRHTLADARRFFRSHVLATCEVLVSARDGVLVGMLALQAPWIRHFAVFPGHQRQGVGTALLQRARELSGAELRLYTFRRNMPARAFYEKHGFAAVAFGTSPPPESEPDVEYRWTAFRSTGPVPE
ncbi:MAG TPA: GNAT family N-acetyltransferase [Casimicrobiaceae bacterium]|nr:GNAT family N-acetyltransferase [Casimicrobiaceae bacterium]